MKVIICVDDNNGILFNNRRQSRDAVLNQYICDMIQPNTLYVSEYSEKLFEYENKKPCLDALSEAQENDYYFMEDKLIDIAEPKITEIITCCWNREYPADMFVVIPSYFILREEKEIVGKSHEKITIQRFVRRGN